MIEHSTRLCEYALDFKYQRHSGDQKVSCPSCFCENEKWQANMCILSFEFTAFGTFHWKLEPTTSLEQTDSFMTSHAYQVSRDIKVVCNSHISFPVDANLHFLPLQAGGEKLGLLPPSSATAKYISTFHSSEKPQSAVTSLIFQPFNLAALFFDVEPHTEKVTLCPRMYVLHWLFNQLTSRRPFLTLISRRAKV